MLDQICRIIFNNKGKGSLTLVNPWINSRKEKGKKISQFCMFKAKNKYKINTIVNFFIYLFFLKKKRKEKSNKTMFMKGDTSLTCNRSKHMIKLNIYAMFHIQIKRREFTWSCFNMIEPINIHGGCNHNEISPSTEKENTIIKKIN